MCMAEMTTAAAADQLEVSERQVAWLARRRATVHQMQGWGKEGGLLPTGVSALRDPEMAALFDLSAVDRGSDGCVLASDFPDLVANFGLFDDIEGDVVVCVVPDDAGHPYRPEATANFAASTRCPAARAILLHSAEEIGSCV